MSNSNSKIKTTVPRDEQFYCPNCGEFLLPADIETVARCPYCDFVIPRDSRYEDYVLLPVISRWVARTDKQFPKRG